MSETVQLEIIDIGNDGEGVAKDNGLIYFVPNTLIGDKIVAQVVKNKKNFANARLLEILEPSPYRIKLTNETCNECGGCKFQSYDYQKELEWKRNKVQGCITRLAKNKDVTVEPVIGMEHPFNYRNKTQYPIRKVCGRIEIGFFREKSYDVVPVKGCTIHNPHNEEIIKIVKDFLVKNNISIYNDVTKKGLVKHLMIKTSSKTGEEMVALVINGEHLPESEKLVEMLTKVPTVTSIIINHNTKHHAETLGNECTLIYGKPYIIDSIGDIDFKISPLSFFQVNNLQTQALYGKAIEFAEITDEDTVIDAYCGIGTISLTIAKKAKKVYGVEIVEEAIDMAKENAQLNNITNAEFYAGKSEVVIPNLYKQGVTADVIIVDPPRKGCDTKLLDTIIKMQPKKVVYVSCDPATLGRDIKYITDNSEYKLKNVQPVDMFPRSAHVETVIMMER